MSIDYNQIFFSLSYSDEGNENFIKSLDSETLNTYRLVSILAHNFRRRNVRLKSCKIFS